MDVTHALAAGMGGIRTAGDLVARMQMARGMRLERLVPTLTSWATA